MTGWVGIVEGVVHTHPLGNENLLEIVPEQLGVLLLWDLSGKADAEATGQLGVPLFLDFLNGVPERVLVGVLRGRIGWQQNFRGHNALFFGVVLRGLIVFAV